MLSSSLRRYASPVTSSETFALGFAENPRENLVLAQRFLRANDRSGARRAYRQALESASKYRDLAACFLCHLRLAQLSGDNPTAARGHLESAWGLRGYLSEYLESRHAVACYFRAVGLQLAGMYARDGGTRRREAEVLRALELMGLEERRGGGESGVRMALAVVARTPPPPPVEATATSAAASAAVVAAPATPAKPAATALAATTPANVAAPPPPPATPTAPVAAPVAPTAVVAATPVPAAAAPAPVTGVRKVLEGGGRGGGADAGAGGGGGGGGGREGREGGGGGGGGRGGGGVNQARQQATGGGQQKRNLSRSGGLVNCRGGSRETSEGRRAVSSCGECGRAMESVCIDEGERGEGGLYCEDCTAAFDKAVAEGPRDDGTPCSGCTDKTQPVMIEPDGNWYCEACIEEYYEDMEAERGQQEGGGGDQAGE